MIIKKNVNYEVIFDGYSLDPSDMTSKPSEVKIHALISLDDKYGHTLKINNKQTGLEVYTISKIIENWDREDFILHSGNDDWIRIAIYKSEMKKFLTQYKRRFTNK